MKYLIIVALSLFTVTTFAQKRSGKTKERTEKRERFKDLTPEEVANLRTKRMTLDLDLTESQKDEIYKIQLAEAQQRRLKAESRKKSLEEGNLKKPTKEEQVERMNARLDSQIAHKKNMKRILNEEQYGNWERSTKRQSHKRKNRKQQRRKRH